MVSRVLAHALCLMFPVPGVLEKIQSIAESDYALERAFVLGDSLSLNGDFIDEIPWGVRSICRKGRGSSVCAKWFA